MYNDEDVLSSVNDKITTATDNKASGQHSSLCNDEAVLSNVHDKVTTTTDDKAGREHSSLCSNEDVLSSSHDKITKTSDDKTTTSTGDKASVQQSSLCSDYNVLTSVNHSLEQYSNVPDYNQLKTIDFDNTDLYIMPCLHLSHMKCLLHDVEINNFIIDFCLSHIADESGCTINALSELSAAIATGMTPPVCKITNNTEKLIIPFHLAECKHWVLIVIDLAIKFMLNMTA